MAKLQCKKFGLIFSCSFLVFGCWSRRVHGEDWWAISWDVALQSSPGRSTCCAGGELLTGTCRRVNWSQCWVQPAGCGVRCLSASTACRGFCVSARWLFIVKGIE